MSALDAIVDRLEAGLPVDLNVYVMTRPCPADCPCQRCGAARTDMVIDRLRRALTRYREARQ